MVSGERSWMADDSAGSSRPVWCELSCAGAGVRPQFQESRDAGTGAVLAAASCDCSLEVDVFAASRGAPPSLLLLWRGCSCSCAVVAGMLDATAPLPIMTFLAAS